ncbi:MAG: NmrA family NAD(P)-binding protein [Kiritimatiellae bacterium]|nr:NmrA family NAD(P)-binding protein [Kiritimatiellia bacterium]
MNTYVITGATGHTGKPTTLGLLEKGHRVRIISRSPEKSRELVDRGAELFLGDTRDQSLLERALSGADAIYVVLPMDARAPDYTARQVQDATAIANAIRRTGTKYAVSLSSIGAHLPAGTGVVVGLHRMECLLNAIDGLNARHLRATYFMENTLGQAQSIRLTGAMGSPVRGSAKLPMVAAGDVAAAALGNLLALDFEGKSYEYVLGERDLAFNEVAAIYGKAIGKPDLKYVDIPYEQFERDMVGMGLGASMVSKLLEFSIAVNEGKAQGFYTRTPESTTATSIEAFAQTFRRVYDGDGVRS